MQEAGERIGDWLKKHVSDPIERNPARILVVAVALLVAMAGYLEPGTFLNSISAELFGIVIAAVAVDFVNERRQEAERKQVLRAQMGSRRRDVTELAIIELRNRQWLYDGTLEGADLSRADLAGVNLINANLNNCVLNEALLIDADLSSTKLRYGSLFRTRLENAHLPNADLSGANLFGVHLEHALLLSTNLTGASIIRAHLNDAILLGSDLSQANLSSSNLTGAKLKAADLKDACFMGANLDHADLSEVRNWTIAQIEAAASLDEARLPGLNQQLDENSWKWAEGGWRAYILQEHGGTESCIRDMNGTPVDATS